MKLHYLLSLSFLIISYHSHSMESTANPSLCDLHSAAAHNQIKIITQILNDNKEHIHHKDEYDCTALHIASSYGHLNVVELLLNHGAEVDATDKFGTTSLMVATVQGHAQIVQLLLTRGADPDKQDLHGESAIDNAEDDEMIACFKK